MIDVGKELESYRAWFDKVNPDGKFMRKYHKDFGEIAVSERKSYKKNLISSYMTGNSPFKSQEQYEDKKKLGGLLADLYLMGIIWTQHFDEAACGNLDQYLAKGKYKTI
tara:strand:- start:183 stop:509 length:327 start_codon:yes stop_codon:yes gene_type:complete